LLVDCYEAGREGFWLHRFFYRPKGSPTMWWISPRLRSIVVSVVHVPTVDAEAAPGPGNPEAMKKRMIVFIGVVGIGGLVFQLALQFGMGLYAKDGFDYQDPWSSETMMQTVSIEDLRDEPLQSLFNIHMRPPGLDAIRAVLATMWAL